MCKCSESCLDFEDIKLDLSVSEHKARTVVKYDFAIKSDKVEPSQPNIHAHDVIINQNNSSPISVATQSYENDKGNETDDVVTTSVKKYGSTQAYALATC